ncbi:MAG: HEAT repeat domain-containing protein [Spirochaetales bacterium]|nr:HEAT repeat domain-containing protein [Spirochaetales bacterium]
MPEAIVFILPGAAAFLCFGAVTLYRFFKKEAITLFDIAAHFRLSFVFSGFLKASSVKGKIGTDKVRIGHRLSLKPHTVSIDIRPAEPYPSVFFITNENTVGRMARIGGIEDILTHDEQCDAHLHIESDDEIDIMSRLDEETRFTLFRLVHKQGIVNIDRKGIHVVIAVRNKSVLDKTMDKAQLVGHIEGLLKANDRFKNSGSVRERLLYCLRIETRWEVVLRYLEIYCTRFSVDASLKELLRNLLFHRHSEVKLKAAECLGEEGLPELYALMRGGPVSLKIKAVSALVRIKRSDAVNELIRLFLGTTDAELQAAIAGALEKCGDTRAHEVLLGALKTNNIVLKSSIIKALGTCGTLQAIEHLAPLADDMFVNPVIRHCAKSAIAVIRELRRKGEAGSLSLADRNRDESGSGGSLSISDRDTAGSLGLASDEEDG